jgi:hypothetical protein
MAMKPAELFGVLVRFLGLLIVLGALWTLFWAFVNLVGRGPADVIAMLLCGIPLLFVGLWFLGWADTLASWTYPEKPSDRSLTGPKNDRDC